MSSSNAIAGKSLAPASSHPSSIQAGPSASSFESAARRPNQAGLSSASGSSSSAALAASSQPMPRKGQGSRKQHKNQRRPGAGRTNSSLDEYDAMAEMRAVRNASSRRGQTSITHLLSYAAPRPFLDHGHGHHHYHGHGHGHHGHHARFYRRHPPWGPGSGYHAADKSRYVHANYRFVVSPEAAGYTRHAADADLFLDWSDVVQIIASAESHAATSSACRA
ncbi:hypothetical protein CDD83_4775 [Cordyceps sp. RAO-2017]|nr:hypothetical protein CDD83_4775 [Cordyceps sp. RAO-2017]